MAAQLQHARWYAQVAALPEVTTEDVVNEWMHDDTRLREAIETVVDTMGHRDPLVSDFHCALVGHDGDRVVRALRLLLAIESKVKHELAEEAKFEAKRRNEVVGPDCGEEG
jgi:hypothetical protein